MFIISVLIVAALLVISELWWRNTKVHDEFGRKFVHVTVGSFVACLPFFLSWYEIRLLSLLFLAGVLVSKYLNVFSAIHSVQRPTWGEIFFAVAVGVVTLITENKWIYLAALLQMSLADGLAAVAGVRYGKRTRYKIFGHTKSLVGSVVCLVFCLLILSFYSLNSMAGLSLADILGLALAVTVIENLSIYGLDNLVIPLLVAIVLTRL